MDAQMQAMRFGEKRARSIQGTCLVTRASQIF